MSAISLLFPTQENDPYNLDRYEQEVVNGLSNQQADLAEAIRNQAMYDLDGERYLDRRDAETPFDFSGRPKRESGLTRQIIDILTAHLYNPGPTRKFSDPDADAFLQKVWEQNNYNALWNKADQLSTLNDYCAFQCDAGEGIYDESPLTIRPWQREELAVWTHPADSRIPVAVCTIDRFDMQTTYRLWSNREVRTYVSQKATLTAGGRVANRISVEEHQYGILPFYFGHFELPTTRFLTCGVGSFAARAELRVNDSLSRLTESINKHLNPVPIAENVPKDWQPVLEPQRFIRLISSGPVNSGASGYQPTGDPKLYYLSQVIDVSGTWDDIAKYIVQALEACHVPQSAYRMEQSTVASGIALVVEQMPLLTRAKKRRHAYSVFESNAAKVQLICAGNHYNLPHLVEAAKTGILSLQWPEYMIPVGLPDRNAMDQADIDLGVKSLLGVIQDRNGCSRDQAIKLLEQIALDKQEQARIAATGSGGGTAGQVGTNGTSKALEAPTGVPDSEGGNAGAGSNPDDVTNAGGGTP